jgi:hypothetical protein
MMAWLFLGQVLIVFHNRPLRDSPSSLPVSLRQKRLKKEKDLSCGQWPGTVSHEYTGYSDTLLPPPAHMYIIL